MLLPGKYSKDLNVDQWAGLLGSASRSHRASTSAVHVYLSTANVRASCSKFCFVDRNCGIIEELYKRRIPLTAPCYASVLIRPSPCHMPLWHYSCI